MIKFWVWVIRLAGLLTFLYGLMLFSSENIIDYSLSESKKIDQIFYSVANKAFEFKSKNGRFPSNQEFDSWAEELSKFGFYGEIMEYYVDSYPDEIIQQFGRPKENGFILGVWRGEWSEYYSSWTRQSTLPKKKSDYYITANRLTDMLFLCSLSIVLFVFAHFLVSKSRITKKSKGSGKKRQSLI